MDVGRHVAALRRHILLILVVVTLGTVGTMIASLLWPPTYEARAEVLILGAQGDTTGGEPEALARELATLQTLVRTSTVLAPAADRLGANVGELRDQVATRVEGQTSILTITARAASAERAQQMTNAVVDALVDQRRDAERARLEAAITNISDAITDLDLTGADDEQRQALIQRRAELTVAVATAGDDLTVAQEAELPSNPASPRPPRDTVIGFAVSVVLAVLLALAVDSFGGRSRDGREREGSGPAAARSDSDGHSVVDRRDPEVTPRRPAASNGARTTRKRQAARGATRRK
jgi:capsular polysaccharide biosynthesis protein